jgi:hypothetical protein
MNETLADELWAFFVILFLGGAIALILYLIRSGLG